MMQTPRKVTADFLVSLAKDSTHAVTLTFNSKHMPESREKKIDFAAGAVRWFLKVLNNRSFGRAYKRLGCRVACGVVVEGLSNGARVHCHLFLKMPARLDYIEFSKKIRISARKTRAMGHPDIQPYRDDGWIGYSIKEVSHEVLWEMCCPSNP